MDNKTKNLGLILTRADESEKTFQQFRLELSGNTGNSNMEIIDKAFGELVTLIGNKKVYIRAVDGYIQYSEDEETWYDVIAVAELKGEKGDKGAAGSNYVLTSADKTEIASLVLDLLPTWNGGSY